MTAIRRLPPLLAAAGFIAIVAAGPRAWAQEDTVYIGGNGSRGTVQVDMSVLDDIGTGRSGQSAAPGRPAAAGHVTLTPPGQKKAAPQQRTATKAKPVAPRKAPAPTSKTAASTATASAVAPTAPVVQETAPAFQAVAVADMPPPPPEPIEITMPPPTPVSVAPATPAAKAAAPRDLKPAPAPVLSAKEPAAAPMRQPEAEPSVATASSSAPAPIAAPEPAPAAVPMRTASAAPVMEAATTQTAALTSAPAMGKPSTRIGFASEAATLPDPAKSDLKQIAGVLSKDPALRVQVMAYAGGSDDAGKARRLSLSRALAVRSYLIEQGIGSTRIDVRALGNAAEGGPADRVDLVVLSR